MGSGHVLVYAFDVFMQLYVAEGFRERDAAVSILINNLFGLEIDKRSYQLAYFALMMKGREYCRRILTKNVKLHLHQFIDSDDIPNEYFERLEEISSLPNDEFIEKSNLLKLVLDMFLHATEIGSVLNIQNISQSEIDELRQLIGAFEDFSNMDILYQLPEAHEKVKHILNIVEVLSFRYTAVVTNPPYLNKMSTILSKYVKDNYPEVKTDLFSVFIKVNSQMLTDGGYAGFMTPFVWMFIKSYEELRNFLIANKNISSLVQMEYSAFEEATVPVCCFIIKNAKSEPIGNYFKLSDFRGGMNVQKEKVLEGIRNPDVNYLYQTNQNNFTKIPGSPISFWVSENLVNFYTNTPPIKNFAFAKAGIVTGIDAEFVRFWHEINQKNISFSENNNDNYDTFSYYPFAKGGSFRRWYGNKEYVINLNKLWNDPNINKSVRRGDQSAYFKKSISWSYVTSGKSSFRQYEDVAFATAAPELIVKNKNQYDSLLAFLNTKIADYIFDMINPTLNLPSSYVTSTPFIIAQIQMNEYVNRLSEKNVILSKRDWDSFEESWEYVKHPLI